MELLVLNVLINQHTKTDYNYRCNSSIAKMHCDAKKCITKKFGINPNEAMPDVGKLIKYNVYPEPYWVLPVNGVNIKLDNKELYAQRLFAEKIRKGKASSLRFKLSDCGSKSSIFSIG